MDLGITGRNALVLGGAGGLGRAISVALAREGVNVAVADIDAAGLADTCAAVRTAGVAGLPLSWELADLSVIDARVAEIEGQLGPVDILVAITGGPPPTPAAGQDINLWRTQFEAMVLSVIAIADRLLPGMRRRQWGRIITSTSSGVLAPIPSLGISNALRLSLVGWSKTLAREVGPDGITANILVPGRIATARIRQLDEAKAKREGRETAAVTDESVRSIPLGRYGDPAEYADAACFLASARASYITGAVIRVDGGLVAGI